jgi:formamidopyrimidine-DNA glycosylase
VPELPEVERARRDLARWMRGATIARASAWDRAVVGNAGGFSGALVGRRVRAVERRGKWLRVELDDGLVFAHLGMTGDFVVRAQQTPRLRWERARIDVVRSGRARSVRYVDPRRFGRIVAAREDTRQWRALGPDPLIDGVDAQRLEAILGARRGPIKAVLLDQKVFAGVGNVLANEALFLARLHPRTSSRALDAAEVRALARAVRSLIARSVRRGELRLHVYGRAGEPCTRCRSRLVNATVGGRTTTFCPRCQVARDGVPL